MTEADVPYAMAIGIFACTIGVIWGYRFARSSNKKSTSPAAIDKTGEELSRARGEYKDYRDSVDEEFGDINDSIRRLNKAYAALLNNFVVDAEKLCPDNKDALQLATSDRNLIAMDNDLIMSEPENAETPSRKTA